MRFTRTEVKAGTNRLATYLAQEVRDAGSARDGLKDRWQRLALSAYPTYEGSWGSNPPLNGQQDVD